MRQRSVQCVSAHGLHHMAYTEWGDPHNPKVLMCVHGLTRNGRDFDFLARALASDYRVVCPDVVGRGRSDWLPVKEDYGFPLYVADMITLIARLDVEHVHWVGTSMGGLIGMLIAALPNSPISRLVLNDVGPMITVASIRRIAEYVGTAPTFPDKDAAMAYIREVSAPFGPLTDAQWRHLTEYAIRPVDGGYVMIYDPGLAEPFRQTPLIANVDLWSTYDAISCPTLLIRGADSDLLLHETAAEMATRGPRARLVEIPGVGHAPMLLDDTQISIVRDFLLTHPEADRGVPAAMTSRMDAEPV
ncbi:alpha/beta hydrolase [Nitrogeniibacter mangrovi]|uniref:Alpha/beta hydrolase n=1 Tax=Nitrogeniibacter mangrovi TaxID=2016596 RepID=A0A6C1B510_9RHOO|nr:alpha/beta hydrolase [Nitrogeniibacter mangrovi]QID17858.1 alpha/beta hydrolase [Nitrogeniibacter mangrovi]